MVNGDPVTIPSDNDDAPIPDDGDLPSPYADIVFVLEKQQHVIDDIINHANLNLQDVEKEFEEVDDDIRQLKKGFQGELDEIRATIKELVLVANDNVNRAAMINDRFASSIAEMHTDIAQIKAYQRKDEHVQHLQRSGTFYVVYFLSIIAFFFWWTARA